MKKNNLIVTALFLAGSLLVRAQGINYTASWLGSTTGGIPWMQNFINDLQVDPDGTCYTTCGWDEGSGGARKGTYKDGAILANHNRTINTKTVTDNNGHVWTIQDPPGDEYPSGNDSIKSDDGRVITNVDGPTGLALSNDGMLMVSEFGPGGQVHFYDISGPGTPVLNRTFGDSLGFLSGDTPGRVGDLRFRELTGVGTDASGNIYISMSSFFGGCKLESYTPAGKKNWGLNGLMFVDNGDFDPTTDGRDIYTKSHHFVWDSTKPAGQEWIDTAYTLNRFKYPDDARLNTVANNPSVTTHPSATWIRYIDRKKIQIINDMFNEQLRMYRFDSATDGEIAIPSVLYAKRNVKPYLFNFSFFKLDNDPAIQALSYCEKRGTQDETSDIGYILDGNYLAYCDVDFGSGKKTFTASTASPGYLIGGKIDLHVDSLDGPEIGSVTTTATGDWGAYELFSSELSDTTITGIHKLYLSLKFPDPDRWPKGQPDYGDWIWTDSNGNGQMEDGEYQSSGVEMTANGFWVDKALNIWIYGADIIKIPCEGLDGQGNPIYTRSAAITVAAPTAAGAIKRLEYDSDNDIMYIISETNAAKFSNWSTNTTTPDWTIPILGSQSMSIAGDYLFTIDGSSNKIYVYALSDGKFVGRIDPVGPIGLIDIPYGVRAFKRSNGEYVVLAEEDSKGKILVYRFSEFLPNVLPTVSITKPTANQQIISAASIAVSASASDDDGWVTRVQIYIDGSLVSQTNKYTWLNAPLGEHSIFARAFDNFDDSTTSDTITVTILPTGISSLISQGSITIYPNPATDKVYVKVPDEMDGITEISIIDLRGRILMLQNYPSLFGRISEIDLSGISNGIYILKLTTGKKTENRKLVVNN